MPGLSGEAIPRGAAVYMSAVDGLWYLADADVAAARPTVGISAEGASVAGRVFNIIVFGLIARSNWTWTRGDPIYVSIAAGVLTQTAPVAPGVPQQVAVAITATMIHVNPQLGGEALSLMDYEVQTGIIAEPATVSRGNGHTVVVHNETEERDWIWSRTDLDTKWSGVELL